MNRRAPQFFFFAAFALFLSTALLRGALSSGAIYSLDFVDINGNKLSTADGHVTVLVLATTADWEKARAVGDRVPDYCLGNPDYRMITIIRFIRRHITIGRRIATAFGEPAGATDFCVFVFGRNGELLAQWHGVPSAKQLAAVVK